jgi:peptide/nickel transport system substrate-binding protein
MKHIFRAIRGLFVRLYTVFGTITQGIGSTTGKVLRTFSPTAKVIFGLLITIGIVSGIILVAQDRKFSIEVPGYGGEIREGVIGAPKIVNPILDISGTTRDIDTLVFVGLIQKSAQGGYEPVLAQSFEAVTPEGLDLSATSTPRVGYTFKIRDNARFHNDTAVTADDIVLTYDRIKDPAVRSPLAQEYSQVEITKVDDRTVLMTLPATLADPLSFATVGIMPANVYAPIPSQDFGLAEYHTQPVGAGPYRIDSVSRDESGIPTSYTLTAFGDYILGRPYIKTITFLFYKNETELATAYENGSITSVGGLSPERAKAIETLADSRNASYWGNSINTTEGDIAHTIRSILPRQFVVFINQQKTGVLDDLDVRAALNQSIDRSSVINTVLSGYGTPVYSPIPNHLASNALSLSATTTGAESLFTQNDTRVAEDLLEKAGYKKGEDGIRVKTLANKQTQTLGFSITTANTPDLATAAQVLKNTWESLGAKVDVKLYEPGDLNQNIIRKREYELLLFGQVLSRDSDIFAFWHTSRRLDPGLNIAQYTNSTVDRALERLIRPQPLTADEKLTAYTTIHNEITRDIPAIFLYAPEYLYVSPVRYIANRHETFESANERFIGIDKAYVTTERVWPIFAPWYIKGQ